MKLQNLQKTIIIFLWLTLLLACLGLVCLLGHLIPQRDDGRAILHTESDATQSDATQSDVTQSDVTPTDAASEDWMGEGKPEEKTDSGGSRFGTPENEEFPELPYIPPTIMLASDLHYMSSTTHDDGEAFQKMLQSDDGKISQYSDDMIDALIEEAMLVKPAALVLTGDLTLNGERENHERLAEKLRTLQEAGVPAAVIPGNHDLKHPDSAVYFGTDRETAETLETKEDFLEIYHEFGYDQSPNRDEASLSYVYPLDATHWLLMLDTCIYEDRNHVEGALRPETLAWLEVHLRVAAEHGIQVLPVGHHNLLSESRLYTTECTLENHDAVTELLEQYHVPLFVSGHLHAQRIKKHKPEPGTKEYEYGISEIVLSPYSMPPNQYGKLSWDINGNMEFCTQRVRLQEYAVRHELTNPELTEYDTWAAEYLKAVVKERVAKNIVSVPDALKERMASLYAELYYDYCAGNAVKWSEVRPTSAWKIWQRAALNEKYAAEIRQMIEDVKNPQHEWSWKQDIPRQCETGNDTETIQS